MKPLLVCLLAVTAVSWSVPQCDALIDVRNLYSNVILDAKNLHRNIISLNLLPKRLPVDKLALLETQLKLQIATKLWSPKAEVIEAEDLALYIQALHASCIDPFDFYGVNLVQMLTNYTSMVEKRITPFEDSLATLTLCLLSRNASQFRSLLGSEAKLAHLLDHQYRPVDSMQHLQPARVTDKTGHQPQESMSTNDRLMKSLAVSCYARLVPQDRNIRFELNDLMANVFLTQNTRDGSFNSSVVTTSLAIQAFIESGLDRLSFLWDRRKAANYIMTRIRGTDVNATFAYYMVPAFHRTWHELQCWNNSKALNPEQDADEEFARTWTRALNQVLNQADSSLNVTVSRWVYGSSGEKRKVSVNIPPEGSLLRALKEAVKSSTSYHYDSAVNASTRDQLVKSVDLQQQEVPQTLLTTQDPTTKQPGERRSITHWIRTLMG